ncbi:AraC family transcriptional regulator, partial [Intestinibacillus massiliensis]|nr:AraC family transcriptional regulator [Intestinibacillus massiliensis]
TSPIEAAGLAGFSDQSHFTNAFKGFIGLTPKQYQNIFTENRQAGGKR